MRYVFGDYSLDTQRYELRRAGELIPLGPQVFNVLAYLVAHRDRVVSRDELFARLWPEQFVSDDALGRCIRAARRALEDRPEAPRYTTTTRDVAIALSRRCRSSPTDFLRTGRRRRCPLRPSLGCRLWLAVKDPRRRAPGPRGQESSSLARGVWPAGVRWGIQTGDGALRWSGGCPGACAASGARGDASAHADGVHGGPTASAPLCREPDRIQR